MGLLLGNRIKSCLRTNAIRRFSVQDWLAALQQLTLQLTERVYTIRVEGAQFLCKLLCKSFTPHSSPTSPGSAHEYSDANPFK
jgi:hypothetical protein